MTIHNLECFVNNLWDWGFLDQCFKGTRIRISDLDGMVERNGWFLVIEAKSPGKSIPVGQSIMFGSLVGKGFTVLILWGKPNQTEEMQVWYPNKPEPEAKRLACNDDVINIVSRWFNWANANGSMGAA